MIPVNRTLEKIGFRLYSSCLLCAKKHGAGKHHFFKEIKRKSFENLIRAAIVGKKGFHGGYKLLKCASCKGDSGAQPPRDHGRSNFHEDVENAVNEQIRMELTAAYTYLSMACYFGSTNVALPGSHGFYLGMHDEEYGHALKLINYQNLRGGTVHLCSIEAPKAVDWLSIVNTLQVSLAMENLVKDKLIDVHNVAEKHRDLDLMDVLATEFIREQNKSICELARLLTRANKMVGCGCTEFLFDKELHEIFVRKKDEKPYI